VYRFSISPSTIIPSLVGIFDLQVVAVGDAHGKPKLFWKFLPEIRCSRPSANDCHEAIMPTDRLFSYRDAHGI
jgi:hypothetical protein